MENTAASPFHVISKIVVPGQVVNERSVRAAYTYTDGVKTYATVLSLQNDDGKLIPLDGPYEPLVEDVVVGYVTEVKYDSYNIAVNAAYHGRLSGRDSRDTFRLGDIVSTRIISVDEVRDIDLADGRKLLNGRIEKISPVKVPRLIGKKNSMINMIANATGCQLVVGRNGNVFVSNTGDHGLACKMIKFIEEMAHTSGLTDRVAGMLSEATGKTVSPMADEGQGGGYPQGGPAGGSEGSYPPREGGRREGGFERGGRSGGFGYGGRGGGREGGGSRFGGPRRR